MQTNVASSQSRLTTEAYLSTSPFFSLRRNPPAHVRRWTGRSQLTLPLPDLAALRLHGGTPMRRAN